MSFKEKMKNGKDKIKIFWKEHKGTICKVTLATGAVIYLGKKVCDYIQDNSCDLTYYPDDNIYVTHNDDPTIKSDEEWPEGSLEQYYRVKEFAETLNLQEGEAYYIEDSKQFENSDWYEGRRDGKPIVSHIIDGLGMYPEGDE